jgi:SAM-dependent methyltransferase
MTTDAFYDEDYFEGKSRHSPPHSRGLIYPMAERTARFLCRQSTPARVLDIGCAKGYLVEAFHAEGVVQAMGIDVSRYAVSCAEPAMRGRLLVGNLTEGLPVATGTCDIVTAMDLFEHLADPIPALREIGRVLRRDGKAYLKICHPCHPNAARDPSHINVQPLGYWTAIFRQVGFSWMRIYETDVAGLSSVADQAKVLIRRFREWAVLGTPADYKFVLWRG